MSEKPRSAWWLPWNFNPFEQPVNPKARLRGSQIDWRDVALRVARMPFSHGVIATSLWGGVLGLAAALPTATVTTFVIGQLVILGGPVLMAVQAQGRARQAKPVEAG